MAASQLAEANARYNQLQAERDSSGMRQVGKRQCGLPILVELLPP